MCYYRYESNGVVRTIDQMPTDQLARLLGDPASNLYQAPITVNEGISREAIIEQCRVELLARSFG